MKDHELRDNFAAFLVGLNPTSGGASAYKVGLDVDTRIIHKCSEKKVDTIVESLKVYSDSLNNFHKRVWALEDYLNITYKGPGNCPQGKYVKKQKGGDK